MFSDLWTVLVNLFLAVVLFLMPIHDTVHLVVWLIFLDFGTGVSASIKEHGIKSITANRMANTVSKILFYTIAIIATFVLQKIVDDGTQLAKITALYIGAVELKSIYENVSRITGRDLVGALWVMIKGKVNETITGLKTDKNDNDNPL